MQRPFYDIRRKYGHRFGVSSAFLYMHRKTISHSHSNLFAARRARVFADSLRAALCDSISIDGGRSRFYLYFIENEIIEYRLAFFFWWFICFTYNCLASITLSIMLWWCVDASGTQPNSASRGALDAYLYIIITPAISNDDTFSIAH